ncbi:hypothetical protein R84B8_02891 [Treponema sp. R8-4-B8]
MKNKKSNWGSFVTEKLQAKINISLLIMILAITGFGVAACSDGGGGGGGSLNGTVTSAGGETLVLNNGSFSASQNGGEFAKGTYTTSANNITMTVTQIKGSAFGAPGTAIGLSSTQWYTSDQLKAAVRTYYTSIGKTQAQADADFAEDIAPLFAPQTGTFTDNTLTIAFFGETETYTGTLSGDGGTTGGGGGGNSGGGGGGTGGGGNPTKWTPVSDSKFGTSNIRAISFGNGTFVAGSHNGKMATSPDGVTWTAVADSKFGTSDIYAIAYGNGKFVASGGSGKIAYSSDGKNWNAAPSFDVDNGGVRRITYGGGNFVGCVTTSGYRIYMAYSEDGINWKKGAESILGKSSGSFDNYVYGIAYGNGKFVAVGEHGKIAYSSDGVTWKTADSKSDDHIYAIAYGNGKFVIGGSYSTDGINWLFGSDMKFEYSSSYVEPIAYGGNKFIAVNSRKIDVETSYSIDGITWTAGGKNIVGTTTNGSQTIGNTVNAIAYGNGTFVAVGDIGKIAYSSGN